MPISNENLLWVGAFFAFTPLKLPLSVLLTAIFPLLALEQLAAMVKPTSNTKGINICAIFIICSCQNLLLMLSTYCWKNLSHTKTQHTKSDSIDLTSPRPASICDKFFNQFY